MNNLNLQQFLDASANNAAAQQALANANLSQLNNQLGTQFSQMGVAMNQTQINQQPGEVDWRQEVPQGDRQKLITALAHALRALSPAIEDTKIIAVASSFERHTFQKASNRVG